MKRFAVAVLACVILFTGPAFAENYLLNGGQDSAIAYQMVQSITPAPDTRKLFLSYVKPVSFASPTYNQTVESVNIAFSVAPDSQTSKTDENGNTIMEATWNNPAQPVSATLAFNAKNSVRLDTLKTSAPFPVAGLPDVVKPYLAATDQVPASDPAITQKARELTASAETQFDAVRRILTWVIDHMRYVQPPESYDAMYAFTTGKGNCQNYSHLSAALMRAVGIPVRIVNGVTLKNPYEIKQGDTVLIMKNAEGRHSWIEVYFPDLKWVPFDPQCTELFVSNRFIRVEVGLDNNDTENDGLIRWTRVKGTTGKPSFREDIRADFLSDNVTLAGTKTDYGPKNKMFGPPVTAAFTKVTKVYKEPEPEPVKPERLKTLVFSEPFVFGNMEFPKHLDFQTARARTQEAPDGSMKMVKTFLVETAEYVTTQGKKYAQSFILDRPVKLSAIGLALHNFSSDGQLWVELFTDKNGIPDQQMAVSDMVFLADRVYKPGYDWVNFAFAGQEIVLQPGRYWAALGFTGGPIVNWFFSYGKPTGPQDGTRYRTLFDEQWSHSHAFEFNYRITGLAPKDFKAE